MSKVAIQGDVSGTGTLTIAAPNTNTDRTLTLPDEAGTVLTSASDVAQRGVPAFSARRTSQAISSGVYTKAAFNNEDFDVTNAYDATTNYRFQPTTSGYYQINALCNFYIASSNCNIALLKLYKNGTAFINGTDLRPNTSLWANISASYFGVVYLNGSTDYVEIYVYVGGTSPLMTDAQFSGSLVEVA